ncbi:MAG: hypothetical protein KAV45_02670, partial [Calditrichia bacterium]|nr:hypothetical protein [Calditrichia bacterium]
NLTYHPVNYKRKTIYHKGIIMQKEYKSQLDQPYSLSQEDIDYFRENGFIKLKRSLRDDN